jgi:Zn-dependent protease/CBS domain-containing protein
VGRVFGITVRLHATFLLLLAFIALGGFMDEGVRGAVWAPSLVCLIFLCIALHELGHSVVAQQLGVEVRSITLLPIGGVAALKSIPENPWHEIAITLAGPMVNAAIAATLLPFAGLPAHLFFIVMPHDIGSLREAIVTANITLFLFNFIPAFPMDGGRLLRAVLALVVPYGRATAIAATVGQGLAIVSILLGFRLWPSPNALWLIVIGAFIFVAAEGEEKMVRLRGLLREIDVGDLMRREVVTLSLLDTVASGLKRVYQTGQDDFPVMDGDRLVGLATRQAMVEAMLASGGNVPVTEVMDTDVPVVSPQTRVSQAYEKMLTEGCTSLPVVQEDRLVGLLGTDNISRYVLVHSSIKSRGQRKFDLAHTPARPPVIAGVPPIATPPPRAESSPPTDRA